MRDIENQIEDIEEWKESEIKRVESEYIEKIEDLVSENDIDEIIELNKEVAEMEEKFREITEEISDIVHKFIFYSFNKNSYSIDRTLTIRDEGVYFYDKSDLVPLEDILEHKDMIADNLDKNKDVFREICEYIVPHSFHKDNWLTRTNGIRLGSYPLYINGNIFLYQPYSERIYYGDYDDINKFSKNKNTAQDIEEINIVDYSDKEDYYEDDGIIYVREDYISKLIQNKDDILKAIKRVKSILEMNRRKQNEIYSDIKNQTQELLVSQEI
jgi:hypothetical protein